MSETTLPASDPPLAEARGGATARPPEGAEPWTLRGFARRHPWWTTGVGVVVVSIALVLWAGTRPGFDPYGWLTWGHQTVFGSLDTNAAPSWKPLPYLFTVVLSLAGHYEMRLWMFVSTAVSLSGVVFAGRVAYKLTGAPADRRWPAFVAAAIAGVAILLMRDELGYSYFHYILSAQSDPMIVALCLGAIDCHLDDRPRAAFVLGWLAALGRPEVWPFVGLYALWCWRARPHTRWLMVAGIVTILLLWFGIPALTSRTPFVAASNALDSGRAPHGNRIVAVLHRFVELEYLPIELLALIGVAVAALRRQRTVLALALAIVVWVIIEIAFALHGWPALGRYMFEAAGVEVAIAGAGAGWLLVGVDEAAAAGGRRTRVRVPSVAGAAVVAVAVIALIAPTVSAAHREHRDIVHQRKRTAEINALSGVVRRLGGAARIRACGEPLTRLEYQTMLAYTIGENVNRVGYKYALSIANGNPLVLFTPDETGTGWVVQAIHQTAPVCRSLPGAPTAIP